MLLSFEIEKFLKALNSGPTFLVLSRMIAPNHSSEKTKTQFQDLELRPFHNLQLHDLNSIKQ